MKCVVPTARSYTVCNVNFFPVDFSGRRVGHDVGADITSCERAIVAPAKFPVVSRAGQPAADRPVVSFVIKKLRDEARG